MKQEIKSLIEERPSVWMKQLFELLDEAQQNDPKTYKKTIIPYLQTFDVWTDVSSHTFRLDNGFSSRGVDSSPSIRFRAELWDTDDLSLLHVFKFKDRIRSLEFGDWREGYIDFGGSGNFRSTI